MKISGIYMIENKINHKKYIGQSKDIYKRYYQHMHDLDNSKFHRDVRIFGEENFILTILEKDIYSTEELDNREKFWIAYYNTFLNEENGYNSTAGGQGNAYEGYEVWQYDLNGNFIQKYKNCIVAAEELNVAVQNVHYAAAHEGRTCHGFQWKYSFDNRPIQKIEPPNPGTHKIKVNQYDLNGKFIQTFDSILEASRSVKASNGKEISKCCKNEYGQSKNYQWRFYTGSTNDIQSYNSRNTHAQNLVPVDQYDLKGHYIKTYNSQKEAARAIGLKDSSSSSIQRVCEGKQKTSGGYIWKYHNKEI